MSVYLHIILKLLVGFVALFVVTKLIGGREVKHLTVYDFISAIVLSELVGNVLYPEDAEIPHMLVAITVWTALIYMVDKVTMKSLKIRRVLNGEHRLVIKDGIIDRKELDKSNMDINELLSLMRSQSVFSVKDISHAFLEPNGSLSIMKQSDGAVMPVPLIVDGEMMKGALRELGQDERWLAQMLEKQGVKHADEVMYAEWTAAKQVHVQRKEG